MPEITQPKIPQPRISSLADRPDMLERVVGMADTWPEFVIQDLVGAAHYPRIATELPEYALFAEDESAEQFATALDGERERHAVGVRDDLALGAPALGVGRDGDGDGADRVGA